MLSHTCDRCAGSHSSFEFCSLLEQTQNQNLTDQETSDEPAELIQFLSDLQGPVSTDAIRWSPGHSCQWCTGLCSLRALVELVASFCRCVLAARPPLAASAGPHRGEPVGVWAPKKEAGSWHCCDSSSGAWHSRRIWTRRSKAPGSGQVGGGREGEERRLVVFQTKRKKDECL